jgi:glucosamine--fructose-6-phosphate aminotransferase (isomerizing)
MCGIVGYHGHRSTKDVLIQGLKSLEYRGYDSAGVAIMNNGQFERVRAEGKLKNLEQKLSSQDFNGHIGIGHTRWATHGEPTERNAHPHKVSGVTVVHNGMIENYQEIREELLSKNTKIDSDTDTELVAHLIADSLSQTKDLYLAVSAVLPRLRGAFAVVCVWEEQPETLVAFRNGPPLIVGQGEKETIIASDLQAIVPITKKVFFLEDMEIVKIHDNTVQFFSLQGLSIEKEPTELDWNYEIADKQGYAHYMLKEIHEQPRAVASALRPHINVSDHSVSITGMGLEQELKDIERVFIVACGTSYYAGLVGEYLIEQFSSIPVEVDIASEFRYRKPVLPKNSLLILISQSGETADTLAAMQIAKEHGTKTLSICNVKNSTLDREADGRLYMNAGVEIGVASTKAFTATITLFNVLALHLGIVKGKVNKELEQEVVQGLQAAPGQLEKVLAYDPFFAHAAETIMLFRGFLYIGRGVNYPIALEGALKLKELAYLHAEGYAAGEMKHGPIALIDNRMAVIVIAPEDELQEKTISNLEQLRARGGQVICISTEENDKLNKLSKHYLAIPKAQWYVNPLLATIPLQLMAYHVSCAMGLDVDQPRNLAKSVTVE